MKSVRVLIVDDSATVRSLIRMLLGRDASIEVVGEAADPHEARAAIKALNPDVITLDVEMPKMNGLDFLDKIMRLRPMPVIMVSSLTSRGADAAIAALEIGAFDCVGKPGSGQNDRFGEQLLASVKAAAGRRVRVVEDAAAAPAQRPYQSDGRVVAIGASTGGVEALIAVVSQFPPNCPPTVITQHMPATFTRTFAERLDRLSRGGRMRGLRRRAAGARPRLSGARRRRASARRGRFPAALPPWRGEPVNGHRPSVDVLFHSVAKALGARAFGAILTGMGRDGAEGLLAMRKAGAATIGQDRIQLSHLWHAKGRV